MCVSQKLPDSLTIDHRKEMQGLTRPALLDPLRYFCVRWICEEFFEVSVHKMSASFQVFHFLSPLRFIDLSNLRALVCGGGPFKRDGAPNCVAWFRPIFCHALESSVSRSLFPVYVPDTVCAFRSSCRPVDRGMIFCFFCGAPFHSRVCSCIRNCTLKWSLFLQNRINSWKIHHVCPLDAKSLFSRCFFLFVDSISLYGRRLPPNRPSAELASKRVPRSASSSAVELPTSPYPAYVKL